MSVLLRRSLGRTLSLVWWFGSNNNSCGTWLPLMVCMRRVKLRRERFISALIQAMTFSTSAFAGWGSLLGRHFAFLQFVPHDGPAGPAHALFHVRVEQIEREIALQLLRPMTGDAMILQKGFDFVACMPSCSLRRLCDRPLPRLCRGRLLCPVFEPRQSRHTPKLPRERARRWETLCCAWGVLYFTFFKATRKPTKLSLLRPGDALRNDDSQ